ncbi:MAG: phytanoyl-CoA dioxygenase family protein [Planctomycetota bacterium]
MSAPLSAQELATFREEMSRQGFSVVEGILDPAEVTETRGALEQAISSDPYREFAGGRDYGMVHALMTRGRPFERLLCNERLRSAVNAVLGETCVVYAYTSSSMPPRATNYSRRIHVDCPRLIPGYPTNVGVTLMLDAFTAQNGATYVLPGSHAAASVPSEEEFEAGAARIFGPPGAALFFSGRLWHRGGVNETDAWRHSVTLNVCRSYMKQQMDWPRLVSPEVVARNPPGFRQFLGYDVRVPASLEEFYVPEAERLYKPNQG